MGSGPVLLRNPIYFFIFPGGEVRTTCHPPPPLDPRMRASVRGNLFSVFATKKDSSLTSPQLQIIARSWALCMYLVYLKKILFSVEITWALIRLRGCAGWSESLLFVCNKVRISHVEAHNDFVTFTFG